MQWWTDIRRKVLVEGVSKRQVKAEYRIHTKTLEKILAHPQPPGYRMAAPTLKWLCAEHEVAVEDVLAILKQHGMDAGPDSTFDAIAEESGMTPAELFALIVENL